MTIREQGVRKYGRLIEQNLDQARHLEQLVGAAPELELALPVSLNILNFRYARPGLDGDALDALNKAIEVELRESGIAVLSTVVIGGRKYLYAAMTNHRTRREDLDLLVREVIRLGGELATA